MPSHTASQWPAARGDSRGAGKAAVGYCDTWSGPKHHAPAGGASGAAALFC